MANSKRSMTAIETVVSALLVTFGVLGLLGQTNMLLNVTALSWIRWWPLALVVLGVWQLSSYVSGKQPSRK